MSNVKHPDCPIRALALEAKKRLRDNDYVNYDSLDAVETRNSLTPMEEQVYRKMKQYIDCGEEIINPIVQLGDKEHLASLPPWEKQKYILEISNAYLSLKNKMQNTFGKKAN